MIFNKEQQQSSGALKDVPLSQSAQSKGMEVPLTNEVSWKGKAWSRKSTRIGVLGIVVICILLSAIVALAVLLYESRNDHSIRAASVFEEVHDIPSAELMRSSDMHSEYTITENIPTSVRSKNTEIPTSVNSKNKEIPTSVSSKNKEIPTTESSKHKEIEEAIMEKAVSSGHENTSTTSGKEHVETSTTNPNTLEHKDTSAEITMTPGNLESTSSTEHEETTTESPRRTFPQEILTEEIPLTNDLVAKMNVSSNDTVVIAEITVVNVEYDISNDTDYDELSEIDFGGTSEVLFGDELELGNGRTSEMEYENYDNEFEGLFDDSDDSMPSQQNDLKMVPKTEWGGVPPIYMALRTMPSPYVVISQTNSRPCFDQDSCSMTMRLIQSFAVEEEDLPDMCDNFYIGGDGKVYVGRGPNVTNCHIGFVRFKNIAVSFIGDFEEYGPTAFQVKALEKLISVGVSQQFLAPDYKIIAHHEIKLPESLFMGPGKYLLDEINSMPHRCNYTCISDSVSSDYDDDSSDSNIMFFRFFA